MLPIRVDTIQLSSGHQSSRYTVQIIERVRCILVHMQVCTKYVGSCLFQTTVKEELLFQSLKIFIIFVFFIVNICFNVFTRLEYLAEILKENIYLNGSNFLCWFPTATRRIETLEARGELR